MRCKDSQGYWQEDDKLDEPFWKPKEKRERRKEKRDLAFRGDVGFVRYQWGKIVGPRHRWISIF